MATLPHSQALHLPQRAPVLWDDAPPHTHDYGPLVGLLLCCLSAGLMVSTVLWLVSW